MSPGGMIDTDDYSRRLRERVVRQDERKLLISRLQGSEQEQDLTVPPNCSGYGRIRHFHRRTSAGWPENPLPIDPACRALALARGDTIEAQAFQSAGCNWRCWYCFVPFDLLDAREDRAEWFSADDLIDLWADEPDRPVIFDLTGGQPDLVPEWIPWMIEAVDRRGLGEKTYIWSDDNLSNDYYFRYLSDAQRELVATHPNYGRVCCFKGFDEQSFAFNTRAHPELFTRQFEIFRSLLAEGIDIYAYATLTTSDRSTVAEAMPRFVDRLQAIAHELPLRTVLLEIEMFSPVKARLGEAEAAALQSQAWARDAWLSEIESRFSSELRSRSITDVNLSR